MVGGVLRGTLGTLFGLVEFEGEPFPQKKGKKGSNPLGNGEFFDGQLGQTAKLAVIQLPRDLTGTRHGTNSWIRSSSGELGIRVPTFFSSLF